MHGADIRPGVTHFRLLQDQGCISFLVQTLKVQCGPFLLAVSHTVCLAVVSQNQSSFPSELVTPLDGETRPGQRRGRIDPETTVQQHWLPEPGLHWDGFTADTQDHWGNRQWGGTDSNYHLRLRDDKHFAQCYHSALWLPWEPAWCWKGSAVCRGPVAQPRTNQLAGTRGWSQWLWVEQPIWVWRADAGRGWSHTGPSAESLWWGGWGTGGRAWHPGLRTESQSGHVTMDCSERRTTRLRFLQTSRNDEYERCHLVHLEPETASKTSGDEPRQQGPVSLTWAHL